MTVAQLLRSMSEEEFVEWQLVYNKFDPFGEVREDLRAGMGISPLLNLLRQRWCKHPTLTKPSDWIMDLAELTQPQPPMSWQDMQMICKGLAGLGKPAAKARRSSRGK